MNQTFTTQQCPPSPQSRRTEAHDIREWLRSHSRQIRDDLIPRAPPGDGGAFEKHVFETHLKAWSDGLPAADRERNGSKGIKGQVGYQNILQGTANRSCAA